MLPDAIRDYSKLHRCHDNDESNYVDNFILMLIFYALVICWSSSCLTHRVALLGLVDGFLQHRNGSLVIWNGSLQHIKEARKSSFTPQQSVNRRYQSERHTLYVTVVSMSVCLSVCLFVCFSIIYSFSLFIEETSRCPSPSFAISHWRRWQTPGLWTGGGGLTTFIN